jgi:hypothetical protein
MYAIAWRIQTAKLSDLRSHAIWEYHTIPVAVQERLYSLARA